VANFNHFLVAFFFFPKKTKKLVGLTSATKKIEITKKYGLKKRSGDQSKKDESGGGACGCLGGSGDKKTFNIFDVYIHNMVITISFFFFGQLSQKKECIIF